MITKNRKTIATLLIILVTIVLFVAFIYLKAIDGKVIPIYIGIVFAIFPALAINAIWNPQVNKKNK